MEDITGMVWSLEVAQMSVSKVNMFLVIVLHVVCTLAIFTGTLFLCRGYLVQAITTLSVGCILTVGLAARSIKLQDENDRFVGDFLDSITPTIQDAPPRVNLPRVTIPPPRLTDWQGKRGSA